MSNTPNTSAASASTGASAPRGKSRRNVSKAIVHVKASFNNTIVTFTDMNGETLCWGSAGTMGFKGSRKSTPFAASRASEEAANKAKKMGVTEVEVRIRGAGPGRESSVTALQAAGLKVVILEDHTPIPHNGCRPVKARRV